jgi:hypothetical protein
MAHQRIPYTCARKKIGAAADRIKACHKKITPQLRRTTSQRSRRCSASLEAEESDPQHHGKKGCDLLQRALLKRKFLLRLAHSVRGAHSWGVGSYKAEIFANRGRTRSHKATLARDAKRRLRVTTRLEGPTAARPEVQHCSARVPPNARSPPKCA